MIENNIENCESPRKTQSDLKNNFSAYSWCKTEHPWIHIANGKWVYYSECDLIYIQKSYGLNPKRIIVDISQYGSHCLEESSINADNNSDCPSTLMIRVFHYTE